MGNHLVPSQLNIFAQCMPDGSKPASRMGSSSSLSGMSGYNLRFFGDQHQQVEFGAETRVAFEAVMKASIMCTRIQKSMVSEETIMKQDRSPVTVADYASQALIIDILSSYFPYPIVAEEDAQALQRQPELRARVLEHVKTVRPEMTEAALLAAIERGNTASAQNARLWWTLDPIDGTLGFLRGGQYVNPNHFFFLILFFLIIFSHHFFNLIF